MAITFTKDVNGKVIADKNGIKYSLNPSMNIISHPADTEVIIITDSSAPLETREVFRFGWQEVTAPANSSRNDLVEKLGKFYFYESTSVTFPTGLSTEAKQDSQIALATLLNTYVDGLEALLTTLNAKDYSTETTLIQVRDYLDTVETKLQSIITNTTGLNLEATQLLIKGVLDAIKLKADNLDVALSTRASEATLLTVSETLSLGSNQETTTVAGSTSSVLLVSSRVNRKEVIVRNDTNKDMYICPFTPATTSTAIKLQAGQEWILDKYDGAYYAIWSTGVTGNAYITDIYE